MLDRMFSQQQPVVAKWDKQLTGFFLGLLAPVLGVLFFYLLKSGEIDFESYLKLLQNKTFLSPVLSLGCVFNGFVFFLFLRKNYYNAARGVILATFLWAIPIVWAKFL